MGLEEKASLLRTSNFKNLFDKMPANIERAVDVGVPMRALDKITGNVCRFIEYEIIMLAASVNVDQRFTFQNHQVPVIAQELFNQFPNESIEDIHLCFKRGSMGLYGEIYRLDGAVLGGWMQKYVDEKYEVHVKKLTDAKESPYEARQSIFQAAKANPDRNLISLLQVINGEKELPKEVIKHLTPEQVKEIEEARKDKPGAGFESNDYFRVKIQHAREKRERQQKLNRASSEFYKGRESVNLQQWEDGNGFYVLAENQEDAESIYKSSTRVD